MDITPEVEAIIRGLPGGAVANADTSNQVTGLARIGKSLANLPENIIGGTAGGVANLLQMGLPEEYRQKVEVPQLFDIPAPKSTGDSVTDFLIGKGGMADVLGQTVLPAGALGKLGRAAGLADGAGLEALKMAGGFMVPEANREGSTGSDIGMAAILGATQGPMGMLPMAWRIPASAAVAGIHGLYEKQQRGAMTGGIAAGVDFLTGLLPGHIRAEEPRPIVPRTETPPPAIDGRFELIGSGRSEAYGRTGSGVFDETQPYQRPAFVGPVSGRNEIPNNILALPDRRQAPEGLFATLQPDEPIRMPTWVEPPKEAPNPVATVPVEKIKAPAFLGTDGKIYAGEPGQIHAQIELPPEAFNGKEVINGFITDSGRFVDQSEAGKLAHRAKQAKTPTALDSGSFNYENKLGPFAPKPIEPTPKQKLVWSAEEQNYSKELTAKMGRYSDADLRETIADLDNDIANTLDDASIRSYTLARESAQNVLDSRSAVAEPVAKVAAPKLEKIRKGGRATYKDEMGGVQHGTVVEFTKSDAKMVFDGESGEVTVPRSRLTTKETPLKGEIATLQKPTFDDIESASIKEGLEKVDEGMQRVDVNEIERQQERVPGKVENQRAEGDLHGGRYSKGAAAGKDMPKVPLHQAAIEAMQRIIAGVKDAVNKHLQIKLAPLQSGGLGLTDFLGNITVNVEEFAQRLKDWHVLGKGEKARVLSTFARVTGHEAGHTALAWVRAEHPLVYEQLLDEFSRLTSEAREKILGDYHKQIGIVDHRHTQYTAGNPHVIGEEYNIHKDNIASLQDTGMQEFFSEMFSARVFGKLKEEFIPPEIKSIWGKLKEFFGRMIDHFKPSEWWGPRQTAEEIAAFHNFKDMVEEMQVRFHAVEGEEYVRSMRKNQRIQRADEARYSNNNAELKARDIAHERAKADAVEAEDYDRFDAEQLAGDTNYMDDLINGRYLRWGGFATHELTREFGSTIAGAIIGGVAGPNMTDGQVSMAEGILMGGILGAFGPRAIRALLSVPKSTSPAFHHKSFAEALTAVFKGGAEAVAADAATGHGSSVAKFMRFLERNMNLHLPPELFNAVVDADGGAAWALHTADDAFKKARGYEPTPAFSAATEQFLGGKIDVATYKGTVAGFGKEAELAGNFYVASREAIATLQKHFAAGLPDGTFKSMILKSLSDGDYLTRQYRIFHDPKYRPTPAQIEAVAMKYVADKKGVITLEAARQIIENYIHEIKTEGAQFRGSVTDVGKKFDAYLWENRDKLLDDAFRDMLGEYHDPREKVLGTIQHLYQSSITGKLIDTVTSLKDSDGLAFSFGMEEHSQEIGRLSNAIKSGTPPPGTSIATLQKQYDKLRAYVPLDHNTKYGKLSGKMVSRFVRDQLATFDSPWGLFDGSIMRSMARFHNAVKIARAPLNPITVVRNIIAMPILAAVGGANPITDVWKAFKLIRAGGAEVKEMLEQGILNVDSIRGEMMRNVDYVRMLNVDNSILGMVKKGVNKALDFYRWPDMLVRGATYLSAKAKFAKELGLPETHADVLSKARDWTNRYTVNYANVAPIVKTLRQVPFTNLFISYTAEMTRITKNLVQDAFKHPDPGQRVRAASLLAGLAAAPFALEKFSEAELSEKDRAEWVKAKSLMPAYQRTKHLIVTGKEADGRFRYIDMTPIVQIDALTQLGRALASGDMAAAVAVNPVVSWENTPAVNIVSEQITGQDLRTGRPIDKNLLTRAKAALDDIMPPILPGGYEFRRWSDALTQTESGDFGITNARTGRRTTPGEIVGSYLTGMRIGTVDASKLSQFAIADAKRKIADEAAYMRDVVQTNVGQSAKMKAVQRYKAAQDEILLELTQKLQP